MFIPGSDTRPTDINYIMRQFLDTVVGVNPPGGKEAVPHRLLVRVGDAPGWGGGVRLDLPPPPLSVGSSLVFVGGGVGLASIKCHPWL